MQLQTALEADGYTVEVFQQGERAQWRMLITKAGAPAMLLSGDGRLQATQEQEGEVNAIKRAYSTQALKVASQRYGWRYREVGPRQYALTKMA
jgi:hypothetical protein